MSDENPNPEPNNRDHEDTPSKRRRQWILKILAFILGLLRDWLIA